MIFWSVFLTALIATAILTPAAIWLAPKIGGVDIPKDNRRIHTRPVPRVGGIAIFVGVTLSIGIILARDNMQLTGILIGGAIIFILGLIDDLKNLPPVVKLLGQIAAAAVVYGFGTKIEFMRYLFSMDKQFVPEIAACIITIIWLVGITNAVNLIDGMDGLAAGVVAIASCCIAYVAYIHGTYHQCLPMLAVAGGALGFLPFNFYPAKTFMGDCGSQFLGFMIAAISIMGLVKSATVVALVIPLLVLGLPVFDTAYAILRRLIRHKPIMEADKEHIHHRFLKSGMGQRRSVLCMYGICAIMGTAAVLLSRQLYVETIGLCVIALAYIYIVITDRNHTVPTIVEEVKKDVEEAVAKHRGETDEDTDIK